MTGLKPIGELESSKTQADDVGEEFVDVTARMENTHRLERRLIDLLATRTGKLKDVLDVEQSLARVREEIERYEGRLRYLKAHTAMSTLTVYVHEPVPIVGSVGASVMGEAFQQAWRNFVTFLALFVQSLGVIVPIGALAAAVWFATRRWRVARALPH
jgi:phage-related minor tail protein